MFRASGESSVVLPEVGFVLSSITCSSVHCVNCRWAEEGEGLRRGREGVVELSA